MYSSEDPLRRVRSNSRIFAEPNYFSPNPASPVVDAIVPSAPAIASPDIPNSAIHFRTISFSSSGLGEPLKNDKRAVAFLHQLQEPTEAAA